MRSFMFFHMTGSTEWFFANFALVWFFTHVNSFMDFQMTWSVEAFIKTFTSKRFFSCVMSNMFFSNLLIDETLFDKYCIEMGFHPCESFHVLYSPIVNLPLLNFHVMLQYVMEYLHLPHGDSLHLYLTKFYEIFCNFSFLFLCSLVQWSKWQFVFEFIFSTMLKKQFHNIFVLGTVERSHF